jgi:2-polyprenyl-3-methyl-5-hydroxy-6-metoxy-1,4-benzoquinol methylase
MDLKSTYNKIADDWSKDHDEDTWWIPGTDQFLSMLPKGSTILDVGCGAGLKSRYMAAKGFNVTGIDFSERMIELAKEKSPGAQFEVFDVYDLGSYARRFDAVFAQAVLLHIPKEKALEILRGMKEVLNPGGLLYVGVKAIKSDGIEEKVIAEDDYGYTYERFFSYFTMEEVKGFFKQLEMEVV